MKSMNEVFRKFETNMTSNLHEKADLKELTASLAKEGVQLPAAREIAF